MSTGKTTYLGLHRWEPDDDFLRAEFNENSDKVDAEFQTMQKEMAGEFSAVREELSAAQTALSDELSAARQTLENADAGLSQELSALETALSGKAASSHDHAAGNITSGTLPVARGGTGNTSVDTTPTSGSTKMVTSGGVYTALSGKAASSHNHAAGNITSGTLPVARGGTGVTSLDALVSAMGVRQIETGTYTGTGVYGEGNDNSITFSFTPKIWGVYACISTNGYVQTGLAGPIPFVSSGSVNVDYGGGARILWTVTVSGSKVSWHCNSGSSTAVQMNSSGYTYHYWAMR